jgi:vanillate O-demethylase ferredoxin subunit
MTIIEALEEAGLDPLYDCQRGDCGICQCTVIEGIPDHRDVILTDAEKAENNVMQICVSRSKTAKLVIEI